MTRLGLASAARITERAEAIGDEPVNDEELALTLALQSGRPYQGLRDFVPDKRLFVYLPLPIAFAEVLIPLALTDDALVVAASTVDADVRFLRERFPRLAVVLVVSPRKEILEALRRVGG